MKIIQVVPRVSSISSGTTYAVSRLCSSLSQVGADVVLDVLQPAPRRGDGYEIRAHPTVRFPGAFRLGWSPRMRRDLVRQAKGVDVIHNHSMWMMPNIYSYHAAHQSAAKYVFSPEGTLTHWALGNSRWRKRILWSLGQRAALMGADCLHATSALETERIRRMGWRGPVAEIPNGIDPVASPNSGHREPGRRLLFLSRIHPTKRLDLLLRVWSSLESVFRDWELLVAGPLTGAYPRRMQRLAKQLGLKRVSFLGEVAGEEKSSLLSRADLFVLPTHSENFGLVVGEALAHGTPVVVTRGAPWRGLEEHHCGWWIEHGNRALREALEEAMRLPRWELEAMGERGAIWMKREFSWSTVAEKMVDTYRWLLGKGERPEWVSV